MLHPVQPWYIGRILLAMATGRAIVAGSVAQRPGNGGHTWVFLQYLLGLRRLGWDVLLLDRLEPDMCVDAEGRPAALEESVNLRYFTEVLERFGLGDRWALLLDGGARDRSGAAATRC